MRSVRLCCLSDDSTAVLLQDAVQKPFEARQRAGRVRLMALLSRIMIRAAKSDLVTIPPCHHKVCCPGLSCFIAPKHVIKGYSDSQMFAYMPAISALTASCVNRQTNVSCRMPPLSFLSSVQAADLLLPFAL